jgi:Flp pilus assembly protein TadG
MLYRIPRPAPRCGVAAVELAILLPFLAFILVVTVDYSYYTELTLNNCARNGALYACNNPTCAADTTGIQNAALADAGNISPAPTVTSTTGTDSDGTYVSVTVSYTFNTITNYPGIPNSVNLARTVRMRVSPVSPDFSN